MDVYRQEGHLYIVTLIYYFIQHIVYAISRSENDIFL